MNTHGLDTVSLFAIAFFAVIGAWALYRRSVGHATRSDPTTQLPTVQLPPSVPPVAERIVMPILPDTPPPAPAPPPAPPQNTEVISVLEKRLAELETKLSSLAVLGTINSESLATTDGKNAITGLLATASLPPRGPQLRTEVYRLIDDGAPPIQVAQQLHIARGEVDLLLKLRAARGE